MAGINLAENKQKYGQQDKELKNRFIKCQHSG